MDELGHILREAREARGLTLAEAEAQTRINQRFLQALEMGEYAVLPTPAHTRGFLRNYARFLSLDPTPLLARYEQSKQKQLVLPIKQAELVLPDPKALRESQPFFDPVNFEVADGRRRNPELLSRLFIVLALVVFLALLGNRLVALVVGDGTDPLTEGVNQVWQELINNGDATATPTLLPGAESLPGDLATGEAIQDTSRNDFTIPGQPTPFPTRPPLPATLDVINLRLEIAERTWMQVTIDGDVRFSGIATRGDVFEWTAETEAKVLTGNAIGIIATLNDITLGRLGERGEAREETWRTTQ